MNFLETIENIKSILKVNSKEGLAKEILELQLSGGTGGEVLISVCAKLKEIEIIEPNVYKLISKESDKLISYARSIDLYLS